GSDISSSRFKIWSDTIALIRMVPWTGVGFGEFNFAWSLTPFPQRPIAFFDHTHNLELQLAVELGLPLAALVIGLLGVGLWSLVRNSLAAPDANLNDARTPAIGVSGARAALVMVLLVGIHSQLEYPLWYAYFLLPTVFVWGLGLARGASASDDEAASNEIGAQAATLAPAPLRVSLTAASIVLSLGTLASVADYLTVVSIFAPLKNAAPLEQRISLGQKSVLFGYQADYAAATTADDPSQVFDTFKRPLHNLIDTRLMIAYADALNERGEVNKARHVVARLREFRRYGNEAFLDECNNAAPDEPLPYQCTPPSGPALDWRDFR
ncbi:Wzy polymerase domain-containing protein, partial [Aquabacterium sp.]|uniref:PglL family O-oligosaccharyltransferase n=1 Tax=Aquabacterium sp. TaxID=1872578 RepID=UPI0035B4897F